MVNPEEMMTEQEEANGLTPEPVLKEAAYSVWADFEIDLDSGYYPFANWDEEVPWNDIVAYAVAEVYRRYQFADQLGDVL